MKIEGGGGAIIGYVLGGAVIIPFILYLISIVFFKPNKVREREINQYITDVVIVKDDKEFGEYSPIIDDGLGFHIESYTLYLAKNNAGSRWYYRYAFYANKYHKYFNLMAIMEGGGVISSLPFNKDFIMTVNKEDFNNPAYGTKANPIPVFKFVGADFSIRNDNKDYDQAYMDTVFYKNVEMYLKYIMPKKEFKARFGK